MWLIFPMNEDRKHMNHDKAMMKLCTYSFWTVLQLMMYEVALICGRETL